MTPDEFRRIAVSMNGSVEGAHMGHPDFRANGKIFATLYPDGERGMVKLTPEQQQEFISAEGDALNRQVAPGDARAAPQCALQLSMKTSLVRR